MKLRLSAFLTLVFAVGCETTANPTPTHMLRLICSVSESLGSQSRIAVLDVGDRVYDYGFATGHAVPSERPCKVRDFEGRSRSVDMIRLADNYELGEKTDWAVIRFKKISTKSLVRYDLEPIEDIEVLKNDDFSFAQARGLPNNEQTCKLSILDFTYGRRRVAHDCKAIPGQSGSPMTHIVDGKHKLVGLHIGHLWMLDSPETRRPDHTGYINLLDRKTIDQIEAVISANRS